KEMAQGVFQIDDINVAIATTGITGDKSMDGIPPGTICTAWGFKHGKHFKLFSDTQLYKGNTKEMCQQAVYHALTQLTLHHQNFLNEINNIRSK
ncbi:MAG TPA: CinA family protein, partial [Legionellaceae bacterium]|nr:CinA family protein [Legionellaceae bacterium]